MDCSNQRGWAKLKCGRNKKGEANEVKKIVLTSNFRVSI